MEQLNGLAICAGVGGLELGVELAVPGYRAVCHVEREAFSAACLVAAMEQDAVVEAPIWDDVGTFDGAAWRGLVDIITAGFPCQPWSHAGKRQGTDDERWIWPDIARTIRDVQPRYVFLENVPGLISGGGLELVFGDLAEAGYDAEWDVVSAAEVGAPHKRERVFILAHTGRGTPGILPRCPRTEGGGEAVGHTIGRGHDGGAREPGRRSTGRTIASGAGEELGDAERTRRTEAGAGDRQHSGPEPETGGGEFPPGPDGDWSGWPGPKPSICRGSNGLPARTDQLRALGNGVVALQAAYAFELLARRAGMTWSS